MTPQEVIAIHQQMTEEYYGEVSRSAGQAFAVAALVCSLILFMVAIAAGGVSRTRSDRPTMAQIVLSKESGAEMYYGRGR